MASSVWIIPIHRYVISIPLVVHNSLVTEWSQEYTNELTFSPQLHVTSTCFFWMFVAGFPTTSGKSICRWDPHNMQIMGPKQKYQRVQESLVWRWCEVGVLTREGSLGYVWNLKLKLKLELKLRLRLREHFQYVLWITVYVVFK